MKIITTNADDFIKQEVEEYGFDYVEAQFAAGFEPTFVNGIWCWYRMSDNNVLQLDESSNAGSNSVSGFVSSNSISRMGNFGITMASAMTALSS